MTEATILVPIAAPNFVGTILRHCVATIVEAFLTMQEDLDKKRKAIMKQWAKRESQIERVMNATVGMYGGYQEIEGLEMKALGVDEDD